MKTMHILPVLALGLLPLSALCADTPAPAHKAPAPAPAEKTETPALPAALAKLTPINDAKINLKAKYYILLFSASWCGPCRAEAPKVVKAYDEIISQTPDISFVLLSADRKKEDALKWAKETGMKYPIVMDAKTENLPGVKENEAPYIPFGLILDASGKLLLKGHGSEILAKYQEICK